jgi:hypothetical protein
VVCSVTKGFVFGLSEAAQAKGGLFWFNICPNRVLQVWDPLRDQRSIFHRFYYGHYTPPTVLQLLAVRTVSHKAKSPKGSGPVGVCNLRYFGG